MFTSRRLYGLTFIAVDITSLLVTNLSFSSIEIPIVTIGSRVSLLFL